MDSEHGAMSLADTFLVPSATLVLPPNDNICIYIYFVFDSNPWPGTFILREKVVNSVTNICRYLIFGGIWWTTHCFVFNQLWRDPVAGKCVALFVYLPTQSLVNTKYISLAEERGPGQSPSRLAPQGTGDKVIIPTLRPAPATLHHSALSISNAGKYSGQSARTRKRCSNINKKKRKLEKNWKQNM